MGGNWIIKTVQKISFVVSSFQFSHVITVLDIICTLSSALFCTITVYIEFNQKRIQAMRQKTKFEVWGSYEVKNVLCCFLCSRRLLFWIRADRLSKSAAILVQKKSSKGCSRKKISSNYREVGGYNRIKFHYLLKYNKLFMQSCL